MSLRAKQSKFVHMIALLILHAEQLGYEITFAEAYRKDDRLLHGSRLAIDLNLFQDGNYIVTTEGHLPLGEYWESIGGAWGGRFDDGNHYSLEHEGKK